PIGAKHIAQQLQTLKIGADQSWYGETQMLCGDIVWRWIGLLSLGGIGINSAMIVPRPVSYRNEFFVRLHALQVESTGLVAHRTAAAVGGAIRRKVAIAGDLRIYRAGGGRRGRPRRDDLAGAWGRRSKGR